MSITREFLRHPFRTGAVAASSRHLAHAMTSGLDLEQADTVVELGPGTGAVTEAILPRLAPGARLIAVELNPILARRLADRHRGDPVEVVTGSAADLPRLVPGRVDAVVSGLPWTMIPEPLRQRILDAVTRVLAEEGRFTTFAYLHAAWTPPARDFAAQLAARFTTVERSRAVWANLPPAFVYRAAMPLVVPSLAPPPVAAGPDRPAPAEATAEPVGAVPEPVA